MREKTGFFFICIFLFNLNCWKHQGHNVTAPETPHYCLSGTAIDIDTNEILKFTEIELKEVALYFESDFVGAIDTTDSLGRFTFPSIVPGNYQLIGRREKCPVCEQNVLILTEDKDVVVALPTPVLATMDVFASRPETPRFNGFCWKYGDVFAGIAWYDADNSRYSEYRIFEGNFEDGFHMVGKPTIKRKNPGFYSLTYLREYWTSNDDPRELLSVSTISGQYQSRIPVQYYIIDLSSDGENIWASTQQNFIIKYASHPSNVLAEHLVQDGTLGGIACFEGSIWTFDSQKYWLFKRDPELNIIKTYRLFYLDNSCVARVVADVPYMAFDTLGRLWAGSAGALYQFIVPE